MKPKMSKTRHGKDFLEYGCKPDKAGGRCPAPASVKASVIEPFVLSHLFAFAKGATAHTQEEDGSDLDAKLAAAEAKRDAALDERLAEALGGPESDVSLRTVESRQARVDALLEERAERDQERQPAQIEADLEQVWDDLTLEDQRRVHSVFDSVFVWRTSDSGETASCRSPSEHAYSLLVKGRPSRSEGSGGISGPFHSTVRQPKRPKARRPTGGLGSRAGASHHALQLRDKSFCGFLNAHGGQS